jgi:large subunit ribosomal protein L13
MEVYTIDAKGRRLGRVASEAASILMGKGSPQYLRNRVADIEVRVENASKLQLSDTKRRTKEYKRYSGYPGGQKKESLDSVISRKGITDAVNTAVRGMLPANKLRRDMLKNLKIIE